MKQDLFCLDWVTTKLLPADCDKAISVSVAQNTEALIGFTCLLIVPGTRSFYITIAFATA